jgi:transcription elongation factor GreA
MPYYFTQEGFRKIKRKLEFLKTIELKKAMRLLREATSFGSLRDSVTYTTVLAKLDLLRARISNLEEKIRYGIVVKKRNTGKVEIGSTVSVKLDNEEKQFTIVGEGLLDPEKGYISYESPVGKALMGKSVGDAFHIDIHGKKVRCKILNIA